MIGRVIEIVEPDRFLFVEYGSMVIRDSFRVLARVALDDISAVVVNPYGTSQSAGLLAALAERSIPFVIAGKNYSPIGVMLPVEGNFAQSARIEAQICASKPTTKRLWQQVIKAKIEMQAMALDVVGAQSASLKVLALKVRSGDPDNFEAQAARIYWGRLFGRRFRRDRTLSGINSSLNYGYAVLRSSTARAVVAAGLHPGIGIHHRNAYNSMRLVDDDLMEPYRPLVDLRVFALASAGCEEVNTDTKRRLVSVINTDVPTSAGTSPVSVALTALHGHFARPVFLGRARPTGVAEREHDRRDSRPRDPCGMTELSAYRVMWVITLFDLPVLTKQERKDSGNFRKFLLKQGFQMAQLSVYMKFCRDKTQADRLAISISQAVPDRGKLDIIMLTDKQYENIITFHGQKRMKRENYQQLTFF